MKTRPTTGESMALAASVSGVVGLAVLLVAGAFKVNAGINALIRMSFAWDRVAAASERVAPTTARKTLPPCGDLVGVGRDAELFACIDRAVHCVGHPEDCSP